MPADNVKGIEGESINYMYDQIKEILQRYGYEEIRLNVPVIHLAFREENAEGYAVVTIDETENVFLSVEQFRNISGQIREHLQLRGCGFCHFLYILVSDCDESVGRLFSNYECFWRIVPERKQLMVFERLDEAFMLLRRPLEEMLAGDSVKEWKTAYREKKIPVLNVIFILINVLVFLYTDFFAVFHGEEFLNNGALGWYPVLEKGEWYRLLTAMFFHVDGEHLFNNMLVLGYIGSHVENALGSRRYGILYILSGLLAGCTSMVYNMLQSDYVLSVGASGAVFGTIGALLYLVLFQREKRMQYSVSQIAFMAFFSLYGGFTSQSVDNAAHIGGLIAGFLLAGILTLGKKPHRRKNE